MCRSVFTIYNVHILIIYEMAYWNSTVLSVAHGTTSTDFMHVFSVLHVY
jgi:hypothetical protein